MEKLEVLNPVAETVALKFNLAKRPKQLRSLTVGLVWNGKGGGNIALRRIAENIQRDIGYNLQIIEFLDDFPFAPFTIEKVADSCQAAIGATGD